MLSKALQILKNASQPGRSVTRDTQMFSKLMDVIGHPYKAFKSIHITGTNGKGSTTIKIASVLQQAGYKVGMYTSPHIFDFVERIKINKTNVQDQYFAQTICNLYQLQDKHKLDLTFFEYLTATAFLYYKEKQCDFASVEVGLGGRYDTTNVILPEVSVITSIAIDHERILGSTRQQIAYQKAGIIKPNIPVVVGPNAQLPIIFQQAKKQNSKVYLIDQKQFETFDDQNITISRMACNVLKERGVAKITNQAMQKGLQARQPCRMQVFENLPSWGAGKRVIFDVGHNPNAVQKIIEYFNKKLRRNPQQKVGIVFGASKDKNVDESLGMLQKFANLIYLVQADNHHRAMPIQQLSSRVGFSKYPHKYRMIGNGQIHKAMTYILAEQDINTVIVCGSFFIMPQAKSFLQLGQKTPKQRDLTQGYDMVNPKTKK